MMTIEDYALDVGKTIDEIKALCDKIGINYEDEKTPLDETDIILLDNELQDDEEVAEDNEELDEKILDEEVSDKAEILAMNTKFDLENETKFEKVETKQVKKTENKKDFLKENDNFCLIIYVFNKLDSLIFLKNSEETHEILVSSLYMNEYSTFKECVNFLINKFSNYKIVIDSTFKDKNFINVVKKNGGVLKNNRYIIQL